MSPRENLPCCAVLLAGGRGTRFWPRSRTRTPKQLLAITGEKSMLRETASRLHPLFPPSQIWAVTNAAQAETVRRELPGVRRTQILSEPVGRNTAAAIGLAAIHIAEKHGDALMAVLPADHYIADARKYLQIVRAALSLAAERGHLVVLGIPPSHSDTGFGYIERAELASKKNGAASYRVRRFTEKPDAATARRYVASRKYFWNAGMFFWRASTFLNCVKEYLPRTYSALSQLRETIGTSRYARTLARIYPKLENISVDYAVMEPATQTRTRDFAPRAFVLPAEIGWSDIGSWAAVYELLAKKPDANIFSGDNFALDAKGNFVWNPKKFVAVIGARDLVIVDTPDALLVCSREHAQDVRKAVKWLEARGRKDLL